MNSARQIDTKMRRFALKLLHCFKCVLGSGKNLLSFFIIYNKNKRKQKKALSFSIYINTCEHTLQGGSFIIFKISIIKFYFNERRKYTVVCTFTHKKKSLHDFTICVISFQKIYKRSRRKIEKE